MLELFDDVAVGRVLRKSFVMRAAEVQLHARLAEDDGAGAGGGPGRGGGGGGGPEATGEEFLRGLDDWERALFRRAHEGVRATKEFMDHVKKR
jgi:GINS complex subunit 3